MTITKNDLEKIADLAYLEVNEEATKQLAHDINAIMDFVDQLRQVNTNGIAPLSHPLDLHQRLRADEVTEENCVAQLAKIASLFEDDLYQVPKVIDSGK